MWITSATKMRLLADGNTPALDINVDTRAGVVTLFGMVPSAQAKASAEADARKVSGVKQVHNELQVVPRAKQETVKVRDDTLQSEVKKAFENHAGPKGHQRRSEELRRAAHRYCPESDAASASGRRGAVDPWRVFGAGRSARVGLGTVKPKDNTLSFEGRS